MHYFCLNKFLLFLFNLLLVFMEGLGQVPASISHLDLLGTRSWIRLNWQAEGNIGGFNIYWSEKKNKPKRPKAVLDTDKRRYYIQDVKAETQYFIWIESYNKEGVSKAVSGQVFTKLRWSLDAEEVSGLSPPSSVAVPEGMKLFWHDEFNDLLLNKNKWTTSFYSIMNLVRKQDLQDLRNDKLPLGIYKMNGKYIDLFTNDSLPKRNLTGEGKISSIQTYNWSTNENLLDDRPGGYFEARVRRGTVGNPDYYNTAFWFDSPGPDLKYYLPRGVTMSGTEGLRPKGQLFEIDMFESLSAQFVMHGKVDSAGRFVHNLATDIAKDYKPEKYVPDSQWVTFGLLWTPVGIKHYINGELITSYDDKHHIYSPDHFMNIFFSAMGRDAGEVHLQVDYIRGYRWPTSENNELPNPGFEANNTLLPWEGSGTLTTEVQKSGKRAALLNPGQDLEQYIYLKEGTVYRLNYWIKGDSKLQVEVNNVRPVTGKFETTLRAIETFQPPFSEKHILFKTGKLKDNRWKTVRISFSNKGDREIILDDVSIKEN